MKYAYIGIRFLFVGLLSSDGSKFYLVDSDPWTKKGASRKQAFYARYVVRPVLRLFKLEKTELVLVRTSEQCQKFSESKLQLALEAPKNQKNEARLHRFVQFVREFSIFLQ